MELNEKFIENLQLDETKILQQIADEISVRLRQVQTTVNLLRDGNTIPFISRYRKEATGELDETQVREISHRLTSLENLENRRIDIIKAIFGQGKLTPTLYKNIMKCTTLTELEDIYAPYKKKKKTRGMIAIKKGLEPLANKMTKLNDTAIEKMAAEFIDAEKGVASADDALQGAMDIIAEKTSQDVENRKELLDFIIKFGELVIKGKGDVEKSVYHIYYDYREPLSKVKPHRILAINRGEKAKELSVKIEFDNDKTKELIEGRSTLANTYQKLAVDDGLKRLLLPAVLREIHSIANTEADTHGIDVFAENLKNLLLSPPIKSTRILGLDPGIRTGTKAVTLDGTGKFLEYFLFFQHKKDVAKKKIAEAVKKHNIQLIAIGNGTGSHEVKEVVSEAISEYNLDVQYTVVSEDGASVYSASPLAKEEFPNLDLTVRGAISIGRRLQDPLAELVKIDPKSIGVGLYQHDVNRKALTESLDEVVESVVNNVGVNLNTASYALLKHVSGVSTTLAKNIVKHREDSGVFTNRKELKKVSGMGDKSFEQAAGFLRIPNSDNPLDNSWVHPENYAIAKDIKKWLAKDNTIPKEAKEQLKTKYDVGNTTIKDIIDELQKPGRDPRDDYPQPIFQKGVIQFDDLRKGIMVNGKVKNVVDFGAFVDIGIKESALLHISEMSDRYIKSPSDVVKAGDVIECRIVSIDEARKRIGLSMKSKA